MDESENYVNMRLPRTDPQARSRAEPDVSYVQLNITALSVPRVRGDGGGLSSTYAEVNVLNDEPVFDEDHAPPIATGLSKLPNNAQAAAHEQESKVKIGNRPHRLICLLCLVTSALIVTVGGLLIHVSQLRQSKITSDRNYHELNSTVQSKLSALNANLSDFERMHNDLRHHFAEMEMKYRSVNETKVQICELLTSRRGMRTWVSCTRCPLKRPTADTATRTEGVTIAIEINVSSASSPHLLLKRSSDSVSSQRRRRESRDEPQCRLFLSPSLSLTDPFELPSHPLCLSLHSISSSCRKLLLPTAHLQTSPRLSPPFSPFPPSRSFSVASAQLFRLSQTIFLDNFDVCNSVFLQKQGGLTDVLYHGNVTSRLLYSV
ncbi:uncharacterized protein LOC132386877 [Hypanus sabinus]|uniref:uncharacterized protein LOC132386877 n=1 Tax=Hypanus sabinus TaxID=79690 RepID=UPI0028C3CC90|nr:uncharacterized protein LOC132386877 [Hypanus sabinus]